MKLECMTECKSETARSRPLPLFPYSPGWQAEAPADRFRVSAGRRKAGFRALTPGERRGAPATRCGRGLIRVHALALAFPVFASPPCRSPCWQTWCMLGRGGGIDRSWSTSKPLPTGALGLPAPPRCVRRRRNSTPWPMEEPTGGAAWAGLATTWRRVAGSGYGAGGRARTARDVNCLKGPSGMQA